MLSRVKKSCAVLNFARFDSLVCIVARSKEKSRSLLLVPFLARYRSLSLSLTGLRPTASCMLLMLGIKKIIRLFVVNGAFKGDVGMQPTVLSRR